MTTINTKIVAVVAALYLTACGGGDPEPEPEPPQPDKCEPVFIAGTDGGKGAWSFPCGRDGR